LLGVGKDLGARGVEGLLLLPDNRHPLAESIAVDIPVPMQIEQHVYFPLQSFLR
jgi:hypothetical protein